MRAFVFTCIAFMTAVGGAGCYDPDAVTAPDEVFSLTASPATIAANGFSTSQITAHVVPATSRTITFAFATSGGTLSVSGSASRSPDSNGDIIVFLTSETTPKTVVVTAEAKEGNAVVASRSVTVVFEPAAASSIIRLTSSSAQLEADGVSSVQVRAEINPALNPRTVTFRTSSGSFASSSVVQELKDQPAGADGVAVVPLYAASSLGSAVLTAIAGGFSATTTVTFVSAAPDFMTLKVNPLTVSNASDTNGTTLTATLSRGIGTVTANTRVDFSVANDMTGESFGRFESTSRSNSSGDVTAQFFPGTTAPTGLATITARVPGTDVSARVKVNVTP